jgi:hypothetical protein
VRKCRQRLFTAGVEKAAGFEARFKLFEGDLQRTGADRLQEFGNKLHLAALLIDGDFTAQEDVQTVGGTKAEQRCLPTKEHSRQLSIAILEGEVDVTGRGGAEIGNFAFDPEVAVFALDVDAHLTDQIADLPDAARHGRLEGEAKLALDALLRTGLSAHKC